MSTRGAGPAKRRLRARAPARPTSVFRTTSPSCARGGLSRRWRWCTTNFLSRRSADAPVRIRASRCACGTSSGRRFPSWRSSGTRRTSGTRRGFPRRPGTPEGSAGPGWRSSAPGRAGLSAADTLARLGVPVTVFDSYGEPGGMMRYGAAEFRFPADALLADVTRVLARGVRFRGGITFGKDVTFSSLAAEGFDAVLIAVGAREALRLPAAGGEEQGFHDALSFLVRVRERPVSAAPRTGGRDRRRELRDRRGPVRPPDGGVGCDDRLRRVQGGDAGVRVGDRGGRFGGGEDSFRERP